MRKSKEAQAVVEGKKRNTQKAAHIGIISAPLLFYTLRNVVEIIYLFSVEAKLLRANTSF